MQIRERETISDSPNISTNNSYDGLDAGNNMENYYEDDYTDTLGAHISAIKCFIV